MVVCQSQSSLVKGVESSPDNGENDYDTDSNDEVAPKTFANLASETNSDAVAKFENISVCNSSDVHFGNKTFYNGPVTIKQFVYSPEESSDCIVLSNDERRSNIDHRVKKPSGMPTSESAQAYPSSMFAQIADVKSNDVRHLPNSFSSEQNSKFGEGFLLKYICCCGPPIRYIVTAAAVLLSTVLLVALTVLVLKYENRISNSPVVPPETVMGQTGATNFTLSGKLRIMQRKEWLAQPLAAPLPILTTPVPYVIISHTATEQCLKIAECILQVRTVQTFHIESRGWWDIGYNFLVGGDGFAYTGRGWDTIGAHAYGYNNVSIGISFIGTFNTVLPPARQLTAAKQLIELGVKLGKISENYKLLGHKQVSATESPGNVLYQELQKWPHWSEHP
ncbi:Uncharacterized protein GBIM_12823 [Gryllus bimaculatus]|uniref:Peptidoglycan recognition protein LC n=1 Tax=Gryllus bimaculatus TaxID=6999 RepID=A0A455R6F3_GRYBI|nr:peptidoglycan recognition protein LC [Gryllus bimaculatus]GLH07347.1 Uncharacterized protein GBIM_12823 [Gryllus bimaculatus]